MKPKSSAILLWTPRILAILFILFLSSFALDVFDQGRSIWETVVGLTMHLLPSIALSLALVLAWRRPWTGALGFILWALFYITWTREFSWVGHALAAGLPFLIGLLFLLSWIYRPRIGG